MTSSSASPVRRLAIGAAAALALFTAACSSSATEGPTTTTAAPTTIVTTTESTAAGEPATSAGTEPADADLEAIWAARFDEAGVRGTFALRRVGDTETRTHDRMRAVTPRRPASTFKILNSLVILEEGAVADVDTELPWDGIERSVADWNRPHSLRSGIEVSAVWLYQELARRVGEEAMAARVAAADYGNADIGGGIDEFWLTGALRISPVEQLDVLERLLLDELPFAPEHQAAVREIVVRERGDGWVWAHKTGWAVVEEPDIGWLVGWTEHGPDRFVFALNVDLADGVDPAVRIDLSRRLLVDAGALPG